MIGEWFTESVFESLLDFFASAACHHSYSKLRILLNDFFTPRLEGCTP